jgi:hypothetical protein
MTLRVALIIASSVLVAAAFGCASGEMALVGTIAFLLSMFY